MNKMFSCVLVVILISSAYGSEFERIINLQGRWHFEPGDDSAYVKPDFDDKDWEKIRVPGIWESQGFPGYDGYGWYRTRFKLDQSLQQQQLYAIVGTIDDVDEVYINGHYVGGRGDFPPDYQSSFFTTRIYYINPPFLNFGDDNVIAIRVYDDVGDGGIVNGDVGIFSKLPIDLKIDLSGRWKFQTGDHEEWCNEDYDDSDWDEIDVPARWETQGYSDYDGYAWYRTKIVIGDDLKRQRLILALGKIDDIDEVFLNGKSIGHTGDFPEDRIRFKNEVTCEKYRFYKISPGLIKWNQENTIAVRVYDIWKVGGIYEGPVGILTQNDYVAYRGKLRSEDIDQFLNQAFKAFTRALDDIGNFFDEVFW